MKIKTKVQVTLALLFFNLRLALFYFITNRMQLFSITNTTRQPIPRVDFSAIKSSAVGEKFNISLVFVGEKRMRRLNKTYRQKDKSTNVLSFTLEKSVGEIFLCPAVIKRQLKKFDRNFTNLTAFLFIHGLMHLKGMDHGSRMEKAENRIREKFKI